MKWRTFFETARNLFAPAPRAKSPDGLSEAYADAMLLVDRLFAMQPVSRRVMERQRMSQGRWHRARGLLMRTHIVNAQGQLDLWVCPDRHTADLLLSEWIDNQRGRDRGARRYVSPALTDDDAR